MKYIILVEVNNKADCGSFIYICQYTQNEHAFDKITEMIDNIDFTYKEYSLGYVTNVKLNENTADELFYSTTTNIIRRYNGIFIYPKDDCDEYEWFNKYFFGNQIMGRFV